MTLRSSLPGHLLRPLCPLAWRLAAVLACAAAPLASPAQAPSPRAAIPAPALMPAQTVAHAGTALLLAAARAGERLVAVGDHGVVLLSDDGGRRFVQARSVPADAMLTGVSFVDAQQGWAVGQWGVILHTIDGGQTWALQRSDTTADRPLFAVHFFDARHGVAVGLWSLLLVTDDGGAHWQAVTPPLPPGAKKADLNLLGLFADRRGRVFATAERGLVLCSEDQGRSWRYLSTGYQGSLWTGVATADGALLAGGLRGSLYRSTDDGLHWQRIATGSTASITALALAGRDVVAVGGDGLVLRSTDGGASFSASARPDRLPLTAVVAAADGRPVLFSRVGVVAEPAAKP